jgi:hypothetical protein
MSLATSDPLAAASSIEAVAAFGKCFVGNQDVQQDIGIDGGDHQLTATNIVHELIDGGVAELCKGIFATAAPFRDAAAFLRTIEPLTTLNSTSAFGRMPNFSRISFGIVTWPRSPTFIFCSMYPYFIFCANR